ncbi:hypothetical protein TARUN_8761 [Trichoderma arundinaceum]|uniref:Uncharacterized protein n=1 Tax=Trichoderma arundinaceum TaxID=490622 RepID=A0A395NBK6_TRIAR|nr:hypothetical protein TARUN_8761 [Trichoderma arundinaceum]
MNFSRKDEAGRPDVITALDSRGLAFRSILSNALGKSWSQKWNEDSEAYRPLWKENGTDIDAWKKFESKQFETLDGSFGLWGAALWDGNRWEAIVELTAETSADAHLDPMALGILLVEEKAWARRNGF